MRDIGEENRLVIIENIGEYQAKRPCTVALGRFDGLHLGHRAVIESAKKGAKHVFPLLSKHAFAVFTFSYSPEDFDSFGLAKEIITDSQKAKEIEAMGADVLFLVPFAKFRYMSPEAFVKEVLKDTLHAQYVCCGYDFRFGKDASGTPDDLISLCEKYGMKVKVVPAVCDNGVPISSTRIRWHIERGEMDDASRLLGHRYFIEFPVERGTRRGTLMGTPTINMSFPDNFLLPRKGVYASCVVMGNRRYSSVTNIGIRPTVSNEEKVSAETLIEGFFGDLYGKTVRVELYDYLRSEKKFESIDDLRRQILADAEKASEIIKSHIKDGSLRA